MIQNTKLNIYIIYDISILVFMCKIRTLILRAQQIGKQGYIYVNFYKFSLNASYTF